jgi:hypothetical protein
MPDRDAGAAPGYIAVAATETWWCSMPGWRLGFMLTIGGQASQFNVTIAVAK